MGHHGRATQQAVAVGTAPRNGGRATAGRGAGAMRVTRPIALVISGSLIGIIALAGLVWTSLERMERAQSEINALFALQQRLHDFAANTDSPLLHADGGPMSLDAVEAEGRALVQELRLLDEANPEVRRATRHIESILAASRSVDITAAPASANISTRSSRETLVVLGRAIESLLAEREQSIARQAVSIGGGSVGAALLATAMGVLGLMLVQRRISGPIHALAHTIGRIRSGDTGARAEAAGDSELAELSAAFNALVDQRQAVEAELERSRHMMAESQRIARVGSWRIRIADGRGEYSDETCRMLGIAPSACAASSEALLARVHPEDVGQLRTMIDETLAGGEPRDIEFRIVHEDRSVRHVHGRAELERAADGTALALSGTMQDITERRRLEDDLLQIRQLVQTSQDLLCIIDADYRYTFCNEGYAALYQLDRAALEGRLVSDVVGKRFFEVNARPWIDRCFAGDPQIFEAERTYPHLGTRQVLIRYYPIASPHGRGRQVGAVMSDVTELKRAEVELRDQRHQLAVAGRIARLGGWSVDLESNRIAWSDVAAEIHGMPIGHSPKDVEEGIGYFAPEYREPLRARFSACVEGGVPFDEEAQLVGADGRRVWVRVAGESVRDEHGSVVRVEGALQDISTQKASEQEIVRLADRLGTILDSITDAFFTLDRDWRFDHVNAEAERLLGRPQQTLVGRNVWEELPEALGTRLEAKYRQAMRERITISFEEYFEPRARWLEIRAYPCDDGLAVFIHDFTDWRTLTEELREHERDRRASRHQLQVAFETRKALIDSLPAHIALIDSAGVILDVNDQWRQFGLDNGAVDPDYGVGQNYITLCEQVIDDTREDAHTVAGGLRAVLAGESAGFAHEYPCDAPDEARWFRLTVNALPSPRDRHARRAVAMHVDITERKLAEQELNRLAYEDNLTGLASRNGFERLIEQRVQEHGWQADAMVVMLDIRQQRDVNDAHGYTTGDQLLQQIGQRLQQHSGPGAIVSRTGGDEFAVFLPARSDCTPAEQRATLASTFEQPFRIDQLGLEAGAAFGYTSFGEHRREIEQLLREAELALFQSRGDDAVQSWSAYTDALDEESRRRVAITRDLRRALDADEFELHFQPKVDLRTGELVACEALLRWYHPEHGLQSPGLFVPIAEQSQLIGPIGDWVVHEACRCLRQWQNDDLDIVRVAVNVSLVQFMVGDLAETVRAALERYGVAPDALTLEITESVFEHESATMQRQLRTLHDLGVRLSLDDFGTGYSSLLYLQKYPFDEIKVDQGFVQRMLDDPYSRKIVNTVVSIAGALGVEAVAEGIESAAVRDALLTLDCRIGQGYYYSMPLEAEDFRWLLDKHTVLPLARRTAS